MADNYVLPADEILCEYGSLNDLSLDLMIDTPNDDGEINLVCPSPGPYYSLDHLPRDLTESCGKLNILSSNVQSLNAKFDQFMVFLERAREQNIKFHVICIPESWIGENTDMSPVQITGYNCFYQFKRRECSNHGCLITYVDNNFDVNEAAISNESTLWENLLRIKGTGHTRDIVVGNIYRPPKNNNNVDSLQTFTDELESVLIPMKDTNSEIVVAGDYNINLFNVEAWLSHE